MPERRLQPDLSQWVVQSIARVVATFGILMGVSIVVGGADRWRGPGFTAALSVPGAPATWGWALLVLGTLALYGTIRSWMRLTAYALFGIAVWCVFFAGSFVKVYIDVPRAPTTGIFAYGAFAVITCILAVAYHRSRP